MNPGLVERFLTTHLRAAQEARDADPGLDAPTVVAGLLALANGLGSASWAAGATGRRRWTS